MNALCRYDAGPPVKTRFTTFAAAGFEVDACPEADEARLAALLPEAEVWLHVLKPITAGLIDAPRLKLMRHLCDGARAALPRGLRTRYRH